MIASYACFGVEYATRVTSPGVVTNGEPEGPVDAPGAADVGLAAADVAVPEAPLAALAGAVVVVDVDGLVVAAVPPPHAVTKTAVAANSAAMRRNERPVSSTSAFQVVPSKLLDSVGRVEAPSRDVKYPLPRRSALPTRGPRSPIARADCGRAPMAPGLTYCPGAAPPRPCGPGLLPVGNRAPVERRSGLRQMNELDDVELVAERAHQRARHTRHVGERVARRVRALTKRFSETTDRRGEPETRAR